MIRSFVCALLVVACGSAPTPTTTVTLPPPTPIPSPVAKPADTTRPGIESANALARAFVRCDRPLAKKYVMTYEEAAVLVTKELPRDRWETDIEKVVDQGCRDLEGKNVVDVRVVETEVVKPSDKELLNRSITLLTIEMTIDEEGQKRTAMFAHPFIETRDGWKMSAQQ